MFSKSKTFQSLKTDEEQVKAFMRNEKRVSIILIAIGIIIIGIKIYQTLLIKGLI